MSAFGPFREIYQVDAFSDEVFKGNPAAVCPLPEAQDWPESSLLQAIAMENNLSETAYFKPSRIPGTNFDLRWFTPTVEVQLCGHATLASAFVIFKYLGWKENRVSFSTLSGVLHVTINPSGSLTLDFPTRSLEPCQAPQTLKSSLGGFAPQETYQTSNGILFCVFNSEKELRAILPDFTMMTQLKRSVLITAPGDSCDFVSRYFAPHAGVNEDPVTGSAHCILTPYWTARLKKHELFAIQASARGGKLHCRSKDSHGDRVEISGNAVLFFRGMLATD